MSTRLPVLAILLAACADAPPAGEPRPNAVGSSDTDAVVEAILASPLEPITDYALLTDGGAPIRVLAEIRATGHPLGEDVLPVEPPVPIVLRDLPALQAEAARAGETLAYLYFGGVVASGDSAMALVGVDLAHPAPPDMPQLCCCSDRVGLRRSEGVWRVVEWRPDICS